MKGTAGLEDRRGKDLVPGPFHPDFHSVSPCPNEFFSFFFFPFSSSRFIYERDVSEEEISQDERSFLSSSPFSSRFSRDEMSSLSLWKKFLVMLMYNTRSSGIITRL